MDKYENRSSVPEKYKWNLKDFFKSNEEFKKELKIVNEKVNEISKFVGCTKEPEKLYEYLENDVLIGSRIMDLAVYAMTLMDSDLSESEPQEFVGQTDELESKYAVSNAFFEPELLSLEEKEYNESILGEAEVRKLFKFSKVGTIAGSYVTSGIIKNSSKARLIRDGVVIYDGNINSVQREKDTVKEVKQGYECGITLEDYTDIKEGDIIESYEMVEVKR